ncbi:hypothetical protein DFH27DRAFT_518849 [Peziza echinospora]|nr:hypothetical protein DFH27DRAFT_518849 [Peziza echinospora]
MATTGESRLYTFSPETKAHLKKFRLTTSRATTPQAVIYEISKKDLTIHPSDDPPQIYIDLQDLAENLPEHTPRFVLLSHPITLQGSGRTTAPYVLLYYMPVTASAEMRMMYAGARELFRMEAGVGRVVEVGDEEEVVGVRGVLEGGG